MNEYVLDTSAVMAVFYNEAGREQVLTAIASGSAISAVNVAEVATKYSDAGESEANIRARLATLSIDVIDFDEDLAIRAGMLRPLTRAAGLSLGDRACLALAERLAVPVLTADRAWAALPLPLDVQVIR